MIGKIIFHYKILEKLGEGGMGVVYKAEDTKLKRTVALKFLPRGLETHEPERTRFLQEAQAAAALNHPNICTIHDISIQDDQQFIVMECVDGKTLKQMAPIQKLQDAIEYAVQIGEALQEAHSRGIVHRDIKTENIMINTRNQVKVMDFGLAKLKGSLKLTKTSSTVGTLSYISPEQIQGAEADGRSDIFSFGVVLYEMLTGKLPFTGEYEAAIIYSIVNEEPAPILQYRADITSEVLHILNRCLEKNPEERYQTVHDMLIDLKRVKKESHAPRPVLSLQPAEQQPVPEGEKKVGHIPEEKITPPKGRKISMKRMVVLAALLCFLAVTAAMFFFKPFSKKPLPPMKIVPFASSPGHEINPAFSPDGNQMAYSRRSSDQNDYDIYVKLIGASVPLRLTRNLGRRIDPAWSPDSRMIAFLKFSGKESGIYKVPALGGTEQRILAIDLNNMRDGLDWSPDGGFLIYSVSDTASAHNAIFMLSLADMEKHQITNPSVGVWGDDHAVFSPDGKWITFRRQFSHASHAVFVSPFSGGSEKRITLDNQEITDLAWSADSKEIIFSSDRGGTFGLWRVSAKGGEPEPITTGGEDARWISIARNGQKLAYTKGSDRGVILKGEMPKDEDQAVTTTPLIDTNQSHWQGHFSPNGQKIVFPCSGSGQMEIWICDSDGSNPLQLTDFGGHHCGAPSWSPDNQHIAFDSRPQGHGDVFVINAEGGQLRRLTTETSNESVPTWSRDGHWIYFTSNRSGSYGIWKCPAGGGEAIQVSKEEGWYSCESQDGRWLYYYNHEFTGYIWQLSLENGEKQLALNEELGHWTHWSLAEDGIYFQKESSDGKVHSLMFFSFASNHMIKFATFINKDIGSLEISPDRRSFLVTEKLQSDNDIYLVENFR